jgi:hypothetical protein
MEFMHTGGGGRGQENRRGKTSIERRRKNGEKLRKRYVRWERK